jgi:hypothetical protein
MYNFVPVSIPLAAILSLNRSGLQVMSLVRLKDWKMPNNQHVRKHIVIEERHLKLFDMIMTTIRNHLESVSTIIVEYQQVT